VIATAAPSVVARRKIDELRERISGREEYLRSVTSVLISLIESRGELVKNDVHDSYTHTVREFVYEGHVLSIEDGKFMMNGSELRIMKLPDREVLLIIESDETSFPPNPEEWKQVRIPDLTRLTSFRTVLLNYESVLKRMDEEKARLERVKEERDRLDKEYEELCDRARALDVDLIST